MPNDVSTRLTLIICVLQYTWLFGWLTDERDRDVKINIICPATEVHIRKVRRPLYVRLPSHVD